MVPFLTSSLMLNLVFNVNVKPFLLFSFNRAPADNVAISLHRLDCWSLMVLLADMAPLPALIRAAGF